MRKINGMDELKAAAGEELGTSEWHTIDQDAVNAFADVTGDHQWIHIDQERAKDTPFGGTIVHGYFTLALAPVVGAEIVAFSGFNFVLNYGLDKVRFPAPVPVGLQGPRDRQDRRRHGRLRRRPGQAGAHLRGGGRREARLRRGDARPLLRLTATGRAGGRPRGGPARAGRRGGSGAPPRAGAATNWTPSGRPAGRPVQRNGHGGAAREVGELGVRDPAEVVVDHLVDDAEPRAGRRRRGRGERPGRRAGSAPGCRTDPRGAAAWPGSG